MGKNMCPMYTLVILGMGSAHERRHYIVTPSPIGRAHTHNDPYTYPEKQLNTIYTIISHLEFMKSKTYNSSSFSSLNTTELFALHLHALVYKFEGEPRNRFMPLEQMGEPSHWALGHWNFPVVIVPTLSSLEVSHVFIMTNCSTPNDDKVGIVTTLSIQWCLKKISMVVRTSKGSQWFPIFNFR